MKPAVSPDSSDNGPSSASRNPPGSTAHLSGGAPGKHEGPVPPAQRKYPLTAVEVFDDLVAQIESDTAIQGRPLESQRMHSRLWKAIHQLAKEDPALLIERSMSRAVALVAYVQMQTAIETDRMIATLAGVSVSSAGKIESLADSPLIQHFSNQTRTLMDLAAAFTRFRHGLKLADAHSKSVDAVRPTPAMS